MKGWQFERAHHTLQRDCRGEALWTAGCSRELFTPGADAKNKRSKRTLLMKGNVLFLLCGCCGSMTKAPYECYENSTSITGSLHYLTL